MNKTKISLIKSLQSSEGANKCNKLYSKETSAMDRITENRMGWAYGLYRVD